MELKEIIELGLVQELETLLLNNPESANQKIAWGEDQKNKTDPLHYVSDCVFNSILTNGNELAIANLLVKHGAYLEGGKQSESPLIGAVSLSVESVATLLIDAGANIDAVAVHGANSLHWASYVGLPNIVSALLRKGSDIEKRCIDFQATPLYWAVQGFCKSNKRDKSNIVNSAEILVGSGADVNAKNMEGCSVLHLAHQTGDSALIQVIENGL